MFNDTLMKTEFSSPPQEPSQQTAQLNNSPAGNKRAEGHTDSYDDIATRPQDTVDVDQRFINPFYYHVVVKELDTGFKRVIPAQSFDFNISCLPIEIRQSERVILFESFHPELPPKLDSCFKLLMLGMQSIGLRNDEIAGNPTDIYIEQIVENIKNKYPQKKSFSRLRLTSETLRLNISKIGHLYHNPLFKDDDVFYKDANNTLCVSRCIYSVEFMQTLEDYARNKNDPHILSNFKEMLRYLMLSFSTTVISYNLNPDLLVEQGLQNIKYDIFETVFKNLRGMIHHGRYRNVAIMLSFFMDYFKEILPNLIKEVTEEEIYRHIYNNGAFILSGQDGAHQDLVNEFRGMRFSPIKQIRNEGEFLLQLMEHITQFKPPLIEVALAYNRAFDVYIDRIKQEPFMNFLLEYARLYRESTPTITDALTSELMLPSILEKPILAVVKQIDLDETSLANSKRQFLEHRRANFKLYSSDKPVYKEFFALHFKEHKRYIIEAVRKFDNTCHEKSENEIMLRDVVGSLVEEISWLDVRLKVFSNKVVQEITHLLQKIHEIIRELQTASNISKANLEMKERLPKKKRAGKGKVRKASVKGKAKAQKAKAQKAKVQKAKAQKAKVDTMPQKVNVVVDLEQSIPVSNGLKETTERSEPKENFSSKVIKIAAPKSLKQRDVLTDKTSKDLENKNALNQALSRVQNYRQKQKEYIQAAQNYLFNISDKKAHNLIASLLDYKTNMKTVLTIESVDKLINALKEEAEIHPTTCGIQYRIGKNIAGTHPPHGKGTRYIDPAAAKQIKEMLLQLYEDHKK